MSLETVLETVDHERDSCQPDEWLSLLIQLRNEVEYRISKAVTDRKGSSGDASR